MQNTWLPNLIAVAMIGFANALVVAQSDDSTSFAQIESDSLVFIQEHHPELVSLLKSLKPMRQKEYETAIRETNRTKRRLESLVKREPDLYALELDAWKIKSKIDLMVAKGIARDKSFEKEALRELLKLQVVNQKMRWQHEQATLTKRQTQLAELISKSEGHEDEKADQQLSTYMKNLETKINKNKKSKSDASPNSKDNQ